jgi:hypothetical protein
MVKNSHEYGRDIDDLMERMERERLWQLVADNDGLLRDGHTRQMVEHEARELRGADSDDSCEAEEADEDITIDGTGKENKNLKQKTTANKKKTAKEETGRERWEKIEEKKRAKEVKKAIAVGKKWSRKGKMKKITSYFKK